MQLQMLGYDITWAAFNIIEVMSSTKFTYKVKLSIQLQKLIMIVFSFTSPSFSLPPSFFFSFSLSLPPSLSQRIGYLAATQCFHDSLDVVMLTTNMIRKDISSHNQYDSSLALNGLACFMTPDLARYKYETTCECILLRMYLYDSPLL